MSEDGIKTNVRFSEAYKNASEGLCFMPDQTIGAMPSSPAIKTVTDLRNEAELIAAGFKSMGTGAVAEGIVKESLKSGPLPACPQNAVPSGWKPPGG